MALPACSSSLILPVAVAWLGRGARQQRGERAEHRGQASHGPGPLQRRVSPLAALVTTRVVRRDARRGRCVPKHRLLLRLAAMAAAAGR